MKGTLLALTAIFLLSTSAFAFTITGVGYEGAQTNCNIATNGHGAISNCSFNANGTVTCDCEATASPGQNCTSIVGVGYEGAQTNCNIATNGQGTISNCSFNANGTVTCSCCD